MVVHISCTLFKVLIIVYFIAQVNAVEEKNKDEKASNPAGQPENKNKQDANSAKDSKAPASAPVADADKAKTQQQASDPKQTTKKDDKKETPSPKDKSAEQPKDKDNKQVSPGKENNSKKTDTAPAKGNGKTEQQPTKSDNEHNQKRNNKRVTSLQPGDTGEDKNLKKDLPEAPVRHHRHGKHGKHPPPRGWMSGLHQQRKQAFSADQTESQDDQQQISADEDNTQAVELEYEQPQAEAQPPPTPKLKLHSWRTPPRFSHGDRADQPLGRRIIPHSQWRSVNEASLSDNFNFQGLYGKPPPPPPNFYRPPEPEYMPIPPGGGSQYGGPSQMQPGYGGAPQMPPGYGGASQMPPGYGGPAQMPPQGYGMGGGRYSMEYRNAIHKLMQGAEYNGGMYE